MLHNFCLLDNYLRLMLIVMICFCLFIDPWLKKAKVKKDKKKKMKQKKAKKKKKKHSKKAKRKNNDSDFDSDIDDQFDKALEAAGLKSTSENSSNPFGQFNSM